MKKNVHQLWFPCLITFAMSWQLVWISHWFLSRQQWYRFNKNLPNIVWVFLVVIFYDFLKNCKKIPIFACNLFSIFDWSIRYSKRRLQGLILINSSKNCFFGNENFDNYRINRFLPSFLVWKHKRLNNISLFLRAQSLNYKTRVIG